MLDILKATLVDVHCDRCGDFTVGADLIAESQRMLAEGCPGSSYECPPTLFATLLPRTTLESLKKAWSELEDAARAPIRQITLGESSHVSTRSNEKLDPRTLDRWEDDGGYTPADARSAPC